MKFTLKRSNVPRVDSHAERKLYLCRVDGINVNELLLGIK